MIREVAALLGFALLPAFVSGAIQLQPNRADRAEEITPAELLTNRKEIVWVDTRPHGDYESGHAPHAVALNASDWDRLIPPFLDAWHPEKLIVVYGERADAAEVADRLRKELRIKNVRVLKGDWRRWKAK